MNLSLRRILSIAALLALTLTFGHLKASASTTVSSGNSTLSGISNDGTQNTQYDILSLSGKTSVFAALSSGTIDLGTLSFSDGPSTLSPGGSIYAGTFSFDVNVDGSTQTLIVPYTLVLNGGNNGQDDLITLAATGPLSFATAEGTILVDSLGTTVVGSFPGTTQIELYGQVSDVPEPGSLALFGTGLIAVSSALRRRLKM